MFTLQQVLNPLVLQDAGSWVISCPGMPFGGEGSTLDEAMDNLVGDIQYHVLIFKEYGENQGLPPRIFRILEVSSKERVQETVRRALRCIEMPLARVFDI